MQDVEPFPPYDVWKFLKLKLILSERGHAWNKCQ